MPNKPYPLGECSGGCGRSISLYPRRKGTMCRSCTGRAMVQSPEHREALSRHMRRRWIDPVAGHLLRTRVREANSRPERREQCRLAGIKGGAEKAKYINVPAGTPQRILANRKAVDSRLRWCPREYRPLYSHLRKAKNLPAPYAKRLVLDQIEADKIHYQRTGALPVASRREATP